MKKIGFVVGMATMVLSFVVVFVACGSSAPYLYDDTVPLEQSSTLIIGGCQVNKFNETKVSSGPNAGKWNAAATGDKTVIIPAGVHTLDLWNTGGGGIGNVEVTHTFLAGHTYNVSARIDGGTITGQITDVTKYTTDVPTPDTTNQNASPFEGKWVSVQTDRVGLVIAKDEWASILDGKYSNRGLVLYNGENATLLTMAGYDAKKGKWTVYSPSTLQEIQSHSFGSQKAVMRGNTLIVNGKFEYRRVE